MHLRTCAYTRMNVGAPMLAWLSRVCVCEKEEERVKGERESRAKEHSLWRMVRMDMMAKMNNLIVVASAILDVLVLKKDYYLSVENA